MAATQSPTASVVGLDPAAGRSNPTGGGFSTSDWPAYVDELYDPTVDDIRDYSEPEICRILGDKPDASANQLGREPKELTSQRFTVCIPICVFRGIRPRKILHLKYPIPSPCAECRTQPLPPRRPSPDIHSIEVRRGTTTLAGSQRGCPIQ